jgi:hypothetical protein
VRFLLDHDVPDDIAFTLTALGHDVGRLDDRSFATKDVVEDLALEEPLRRDLEDVAQAAQARER